MRARGSENRGRDGADDEGRTHAYILPVVILENGLIRTLDPQVPTQRALAIAGERIAGGVGVHETALASPEVVDLGGRTVLPGLNDAHVHFPTWALAQTEVKLEGCGSLAEAVERVRGALGLRGRWLRGYGWRSADWSEGREPTRHDLDPLTGERPTALIAKDYHSLWLNSAGLALAGGDLEVAGGVVERDADGEPTGVLREEAAWQFKERFMTVADEEYLEAMRAGVVLANARGVTAVHDKDGWLGALRLWQQLDERGSLSLRVWQSIPAEQLDAVAGAGIRSGLGGPLLRLGYLKVFMDGTLGSQTAWMLDGSGVRITSGDELAEIVRHASTAGWPVAVHAIGDRANREALDAFEQTRELWAPRGLRQRIEHAQLLAPEDLPRFAALGVACSVQFSHAPSDRDLADRFWAGKTDGAYAYRSLLESGAVVANGSDAPIEELDPLPGVRAGVRRTIDEREAWHPEQVLTVEQAFHATCVTACWLAGDERRRGTLVPGRYADLVVLDRDPWDDLDAQVVATMVGGRWVHNPPPWD
ncbi:MAG TPA: amidohydrolase [Gaiellaceae bacterium]|nr:amidohydrolase [Gaiellaceae bacterium]